MILIIAYGNPLRQDDGAGLILAERLEQAWLACQIEVERLAVHQLIPELTLEVAREGVSAVVFVDTRAVLPNETEFETQMNPVSAGQVSSALGHHLDPTMLLTYVRLLYGKQLPAWLVTVPGVDFGHGEELSQLARQALNARPDLSTELLNHLQNKD
jgi:hydrogenase maturation protease